MATPKNKAGLIQDITNRFSVTAREARDIVTAVSGFGAVMKGNPAGDLGGKAKQLSAAAKNLKTQVSETGKAAKTGKKGTPSKQYMTLTGDQPARFTTPSGTTRNQMAAKKVVTKSAMGQSAKSHQKDLAKMSGNTAAAKKFKADKAAGKMNFENKPSPSFTAGKKAEKKTLNSFKKSK